MEEQKRSTTPKSASSESTADSEEEKRPPVPGPVKIRALAGPLDTIPETDSECSLVWSELSSNNGVRKPYSHAKDEAYWLNMEYAQHHMQHIQEQPPGDPPNRRLSSQSGDSESLIVEYTSEEEELEQLTYAEKNARHQEYSPSTYNSNLFNQSVYNNHKLEIRIGKGCRFEAKKATVTDILFYQEPTLLLARFTEEHFNRAQFGFFTDLYYTPEYCLSRLEKGINFLKVGYASRALLRVRVNLNTKRTRLTLQSDWKTHFKIKDMMGIIIGKQSGTFKFGEMQDIKKLQEFDKWQCISIIMHDRTLDLAVKVQSHLIDFWIAMSFLIYEYQVMNNKKMALASQSKLPWGKSSIIQPAPPSWIPVNRYQIVLTIVKMKLEKEWEERGIFLNDLFLLAIYRSMKYMDRITPVQTKAIYDRINYRYLPSTKFYRIMKMTNIDRFGFAKTEMGTAQERKDMLQSFKTEMQIHKKIQKLRWTAKLEDTTNEEPGSPLGKKKLRFKQYKRLSEQKPQEKPKAWLLAQISLLHAQNLKELDWLRVDADAREKERKQRHIKGKPSNEHKSILRRYCTGPIPLWKEFQTLVNQANVAHNKAREVEDWKTQSAPEVTTARIANNFEPFLLSPGEDPLSHESEQDSEMPLQKSSDNEYTISMKILQKPRSMDSDVEEPSM